MIGIVIGDQLISNEIAKDSCLALFVSTARSLLKNYLERLMPADSQIISLTLTSLQTSPGTFSTVLQWHPLEI